MVQWLPFIVVNYKLKRSRWGGLLVKSKIVILDPVVIYTKILRSHRGFLNYAIHLHRDTFKSNQINTLCEENGS